MSPSGLLISMREVLRKKSGREKLFRGLESFFERGDARRQLALSLLSPLCVWHIALTAIHSAVLPETTASSNYPGVRQPCSFCCFFNKRSLLRRTEKQGCTIHCRDHSGLSKSPISIWYIYELFTGIPLRETVCGFWEMTDWVITPLAGWYGV